MSLFKDMLGSEESLFKDEVALDFSFMPKMIPYREDCQRRMAYCIKPLFQKRNGKNLFIYGVPGIGKTLACRHVLKELEEETDDIIPIYINCWQKNTTFKVMIEICEILGYKLIMNKSSDELFKDIRNIINKKAAVFVFDEIDKADDLDFVYSVLEEIYRKTIFFVTNSKEWLYNVEERLKSRLMLEMLEFKPYNYEETKGILRQRIEYAFVPGVLSDEAFKLILKKTVEIKDIRCGLYMLREAGLNAENRSSKKITAEDARIAIKRLGDYNISKAERLEDESKFILNLIKNNSNKRMGELYKIYKEVGGNSSYRTFFRKINKLADNNLVLLEKKSGGKEGNTTIVRYFDKSKETQH